MGSACRGARTAGPLPAVCCQPPTRLVQPVPVHFLVFACLFECLSAVCQASKLGDSLEDRYPSFDFEKIKQGQAQLGWAGELEQAAAQVGEQWQPFMTVATATEAGLYKT